MYNQPFYIPPFYGNVMRNYMGGNMLRGNIFSRLSSLWSGIKSYNWSGLINNTSKTLGIINQSIPIVKQVKPVMNNVRSMMKIASVFKDETDNISSNISEDKPTYVNNYSQSPTFFL